MLKKGDILLVIVILGIIGIGVFFINLYNNNDDYSKIAVIKQDNKIIRTIDLDKVNEPYNIEIGGKYKETIRVEKGRIRFLDALCPDQVCVRTGWLSQRGDTSVCLPNKAIIIIQGEKSEIDGVTY